MYRRCVRIHAKWAFIVPYSISNLLKVSKFSQVGIRPKCSFLINYDAICSLHLVGKGTKFFWFEQIFFSLWRFVSAASPREVGVINVSWSCPLIRGSACSPFGKGRGVCFELIIPYMCSERRVRSPKKTRVSLCEKNRLSLKKYWCDFNISRCYGRGSEKLRSTSALASLKLRSEGGKMAKVGRGCYVAVAELDRVFPEIWPFLRETGLGI